jgi:hypothetical protein
MVPDATAGIQDSIYDSFLMFPCLRALTIYLVNGRYSMFPLDGKGAGGLFSKEFVGSNPSPRI